MSVLDRLTLRIAILARMLQLKSTYESRFHEAIEEGRASVRSGNLLDHDEVVRRIEKILES